MDYRAATATSYTWLCVSGTMYKVTFPVYAYSLHWESHSLQGTRTTRPCIIGHYVHLLKGSHKRVGRGNSICYVTFLQLPPYVYYVYI